MLGSYLARLSSVALRTAVRQRAPVLDEIRIPLRIWPTDVDTYLHVNNGRYLTLMDCGRLAHGIQTGLLVQMVRRKWTPVVGAATVSYFKELRSFDAVDLTTRLAAWDEKWFFIEHRFERAGTLYALGLVKGVAKHRGKTVPPAELVKACGYDGPAPEPTELIVQWSQVKASSGRHAG